MKEVHHKIGYQGRVVYITFILIVIYLTDISFPLLQPIPVSVPATIL